jgi:hypothetical protein
MSISSDGAMALAFTLQAPGMQKPASEFRKEFDRSKVFMVMKQQFDGFTRLTVLLDGGHRFEIDSDKVPFNIDRAADWLVGEA